MHASGVWSPSIPQPLHIPTGNVCCAQAQRIGKIVKSLTSAPRALCMCDHVSQPQMVLASGGKTLELLQSPNVRADFDQGEITFQYQLHSSVTSDWHAFMFTSIRMFLTTANPGTALLLQGVCLLVLSGTTCPR